MKSISIITEDDIFIASIMTLTECENLGMSESDAFLCSTSVSELATNIIRYGESGIISLRHTRKTLYITAIDTGYGIEDINLAMTDGYSSGSGRGVGLPGVSRMMDSFHIESKIGKGTTVEISKQCNCLTSITKWFDIGKYMKPHPDSTISGDGILVVDWEEITVVSVWDISGHGIDAHNLSEEVKSLIKQNIDKSPNIIIMELNERFKGTRGLVVLVACLNSNSGLVTYSGAGNISLLHLSWPDSLPHRLYCQDGIVGYQNKTPVNQQLQIKPNDYIIIHSHGICSIRKQLDIKFQNNPNKMAAYIAKNHQSTQDDDISCLAIHYRCGDLTK